MLKQELMDMIMIGLELPSMFTNPHIYFEKFVCEKCRFNPTKKDNYPCNVCCNKSMFVIGENGVMELAEKICKKIGLE